MEARREQPSLARSDNRTVVESREDVDPATNVRYQRCADEDRVEGTRPQLRDIEIGLEAVDLSPERVSFDGHIHEAREWMRMTGDVFGNEDRTGTGSPDGHAFGRTVAQLLDEAVLARELTDRRALTARNDERVDRIELLRPADVDGFDADALERRQVLREVALETEDAGACGQRAGVTG